jgi:glycosyltransferase involved in cell wall biosynthesis
LTRRIAIVLQTPRDRHSSVFLTYEALAAELGSRGYHVTLLTPADFPALARLGGRLTPLAYPVAVAGWVRRTGSSADVLIFHSYAGWLALATGAARPSRTVVAFHGLEPIYHQELLAQSGGDLSWRYRVLQERLMPGFLRAACRRADLITCLNSTEADFLARNGWAEPGRIATVAHGVPEAFFLPDRPARPVRRLLFVGQWLPMKGIDALAHAFAAIARRRPEVGLVCAGTLAEAAVVLASFSEDVRSRVSVIPRIDQQSLVDVYRNADAFLFPSVYEGFGLALVEAMAAQLPIVTTAVGVAKDALADGESALFVPARSADAIVRAVERLIDDTEVRVRLSEGAAAIAGRYHERDRVREWADRVMSVRPR